MNPRPRSPLAPTQTWSAARATANVQAALRELRCRSEALNGVRGLAHLLNPLYIDGEFNKRLGAIIDGFLDACEAGLCPRTMIFAPPRSGKSELISRVLPLRILGRHPGWEVIGAAGTQLLADEFGLFVRNGLNDPLFAQLYPKCILDASSNAVSRISTTCRGGYRGLSVGTQIVGRGAHVLIIDDPIAGRDQAYSEGERRALYYWYTSNARTRLAPGGGIILMHQRWHPDDLAGELLAHAAANSKADQWQVHSFTALAEPGDPWREPGEPLFPERYPLAELEAIRNTQSEEEWLAMYQQQPVRASGGFFKADWFQYYSQLPKDLNWYLCVDFAASTATYADDTAIFPVGIAANRDLYVAPDFFLGRAEAPQVADTLLALATKYKVLGIACDNQVLDKVFMPFLRERMRKKGQFFHFHPVNRSQAKHIVAVPLQARMSARSVWWPDTQPVREKVKPQFLNFIPDADNKHDDAIDALANGCQMLASMVAPEPHVPLPAMSPQAEEDEQWQKILSRGPQAPESAPFHRLNGDPYKAQAL